MACSIAEFCARDTAHAAALFAEGGLNDRKLLGGAAAELTCARAAVMAAVERCAAEGLVVEGDRGVALGVEAGGFGPEGLVVDGQVQQGGPAGGVVGLWQWPGEA